MPTRLVFLLEEPSMKNLPVVFYSRLLPARVYHTNFYCTPHEVIIDMDRNLPRKLTAWKIPNDQFVIVRDNDGAPCKEIKARFTNLCHAHGRPDTLVRLVCQELESWYIGDLPALAVAFEDTKLANPKNLKRFVQPDTWQKPSVELERMIPTFQKGSAATLMGKHLSVDEKQNKSESFQFFVQGLRRIASKNNLA